MSIIVRINDNMYAQHITKGQWYLLPVVLLLIDTE